MKTVMYLLLAIFLGLMLMGIFGVIRENAKYQRRVSQVEIIEITDHRSLSSIG